MIAVDSNLLIYSHREDSEFFESAQPLIDSLRHQSSPWAIPWPCVHEFISIVTHPRIYKPATRIDEALDAVDSWLAGGNVVLLSESAGYFKTLRTIALTAKSTGAIIHDARIAALCLHHGVREFWTADRDFLSFPQLKVRNPLVTP